MSHEVDNGVTEPLLKGRSNSTTNVVYDRNAAEHVERGDAHVKRGRPLRDSYLKQLGYTPLIFKVNSFLWRVSMCCDVKCPPNVLLDGGCCLVNLVGAYILGDYCT